MPMFTTEDKTYVDDSPVKRFFRRYRPYIVVVLIAIIAIIIAAIVTVIVSQIMSPKPVSLLRASEYGVVTDDQGLITQVFDGPSDETDTIKATSSNFHSFYDAPLPHGESFDTEITIDGAAVLYSYHVSGTISREDAVAYYNQRVGDGIRLDLAAEQSLETVVLDDIFTRVKQAMTDGRLPQLTFAVDGPPKITFDQQVADAYAAYQTAVTAIEGLMPTSSMNSDSSMHANTDSIPSPIRDDFLSNPYFVFACADYDVVPTNWDEVSSQFSGIVGDSGVIFQGPPSDTITRNTPQPCVYLTQE